MILDPDPQKKHLEKFVSSIFFWIFGFLDPTILVLVIFTFPETNRALKMDGRKMISPSGGINKRCLKPPTAT